MCILSFQSFTAMFFVVLFIFSLPVFLSGILVVVIFNCLLTAEAILSSYQNKPVYRAFVRDARSALYIPLARTVSL
jgi:hypothetical protein